MNFDPIKPQEKGRLARRSKLNEVIARLNARGNLRLGPDGVGRINDDSDAETTIELNTLSLYVVENGAPAVIAVVGFMVNDDIDSGASTTGGGSAGNGPGSGSGSGGIGQASGDSFDGSGNNPAGDGLAAGPDGDGLYTNDGGSLTGNDGD